MNIADRYIPDPHPVKQAVGRLFDITLQESDPTGVGESWALAIGNYKALSQVRSRVAEVGGCTYKVQFNPARITSSAAKVDTKSIQERKCFLCPANLPPEQKAVPFKEDYLVLVNPFPIFPRHLTIPDREHIDQRILRRVGDMLDLAEELDDYIIFYNGPKCGASAPDHLHFQAGNKGFLPIEKEWSNHKAGKVADYKAASLWYLNDAPRATLLIESTDKSDAVYLFTTIYEAMQAESGAETDGEEPMMNVLAWYAGDKWIVCVFPRALHRPSCFFAEGESNILISPAAVDMGGVFITPLEKDFDKLTAEDIHAILAEVCIAPEAFHKLRQHIKEQISKSHDRT